QDGGRLELRRARGRDELVQGVERLELDTGAPVEIGRGDLLEDRLDDAVGAAVPVVDRVAEKSPVTIEEPEVDAPAVDAHRVEPPDMSPGLSQTVEDGPVQRQSVPVQHGTDDHRSVPKARHFFHTQLSVCHYAEHHAATGSTEIDREVVGWRRHLGHGNGSHGTAAAQRTGSQKLDRSFTERATA